MSNPKRGEMLIQLGTKEFQGRVTLDVAMRIERKLGRGVLKIGQAMSEGDITTSDIVDILTPVIRAGGKDIKDKDVQDAVWDAGLAEGIRVCGEVVTTILTGGRGDSGNEEVAEA